MYYFNVNEPLKLIQMYTLAFAERRILPDLPWLIKKPDKHNGQIAKAVDEDAPRRKRNEFGKYWKCVMMVQCTNCRGSWIITMPEAVRFALIGGFEMPQKFTLFSHRIYTNFCDECKKPGQVPEVEIAEYLEEKKGI